MASPSVLPASGISDEISCAQNSIKSCNASRKQVNLELQKKRKVHLDGDSFICGKYREIKHSLPTLRSPDYFIEPCIDELEEREIADTGYCSRVPDFTIGRIGYGFIKFCGNTDVRRLDLDQIVKIQRHQVIVYDDESSKPVVGKGLNKAAEVTLVVNIANQSMEKEQVDYISTKLKQSCDRQGAAFLSFNPANGFWKFSVPHFSRFGLSDDEAEDITMDDASGLDDRRMGINGDIDEEHQLEPELSHSLPAHLGLDPIKMKEMRMLMFPSEDQEEMEGFRGQNSHPRSSLTKQNAKSSQKKFTPKSSHRDMPLALLEYTPSSDKSSPGSILMAQQNKGLAVKKPKTTGFELDLSHVTPITKNYSHNVVDASLFMGRSFRAGWGPNGVLFHTGTSIGTSSSQRVLSSMINVEKIAVDKAVQGENEKVKKELVNIAFEAPLRLHKEIDHETEEISVGLFKLKLHKVVTDRVILSDICRSYIDIVEKHLEVSGISTSSKLVLMHQVMGWELIKVLFSEKENTLHSKSDASDNEEEMMQDMMEDSSEEVDPEAKPLIRRADFSCWLQESVSHRVHEDVNALNEGCCYLEQLFFLLTGRQLVSAVELAASKGDVRLACLLSQAGGSTVNRADIGHQLELWTKNGLDFNYIEKERIRVYELLAGNILESLQDVTIDWKRFLGLLMWYDLPPDTSLPVIFQNYQLLLQKGRAPFPVPIYIDEGPEANILASNNRHFDFLYYLMLLHGNEEKEVDFLKTMFSAFSSTDDPLDHHMIWSQRGVLEAVGAFTSDDLQALDMGFVTQLLSQGLVQWAIYVILHIPHREDYPYLQANAIREILFQFCETWSSDESQWEFIKDLGVPSEWMHEALAIYNNYHGDYAKAVEHFLDCANLAKAHSIFITSVAHSLFLSDNHSEIWRIATSMDDHKSEIENWDLGAGIFMSFYLLKGSLQEEEDDDTMPDLDSLESKNESCRSFIGRLNESLAVWGDKLPVEARVAYSKMAEEICGMLLSDLSKGSSRESQLSCFETAFVAPVPEDLRSTHLQDAVSLFSLYLSENGQTFA